MNNRLLAEDTIAAIATGVSGAGIGIVRISGRNAVAVADKIFVQKHKLRLADAESHKLYYGKVVYAESNEIIDEVLVSKMNGPHSYTAEDVVEINCHGGSIVLSTILNEILNQGVRLAEPGEFTKRAFLNGRLDLSQAEAVMDVISAKTEKGLKISINQLKGGLSDKLKGIDTILMDALVDIEANIDYPEYEIPEVSENKLRGILSDTIDTIDALLVLSRAGKIVREGITTAILGEPNVGKSSLLNCLLMENKAIVTEIPGTTRDIIEEVINIDGIPFKIIDTAGLRETQDIVEKIGVEKARQLKEDAEIIVFVSDLSRPMSASEIEVVNSLNLENSILVANKEDIKTPVEDCRKDWLQISILENKGIEDLRKQLINKAMKNTSVDGNEEIISNSRHIDLLKKVKSSLEDGLVNIETGHPLEMIAIDVQDGISHLREISGESIGDDVIENIFQKFCIGK